PVAVCLEAIARAGDMRGKGVLIVGDGPFGNIIARLALRTGAQNVIVAGREPFRLSRIPAVQTTTSAPRASVDIAILAVSSEDAVVACMEALRPRGRMVVFSALHRPVPLNLLSLHLRELEIVGSCNDENRLDDALFRLCEPSLGLHEI